MLSDTCALPAPAPSPIARTAMPIPRIVIDPSSRTPIGPSDI
jgi:hypothetical protein